MKIKTYIPIALTWSLLLLSACSQNKTGKTDISGSSATKDTLNDTIAGSDDISSNEDWLLIPGEAAGRTKINQDEQEVVKRLGKPDGGDAAMGKNVAIWYNNHDTTAHSVAVYCSRMMGREEISRVRLIRVTSPSFKTKEGIHTSSSVNDIRKYFPVKKTETYQDQGVSYVVYDSSKGIAFEVDPDSTCVAIVIHEAGKIGEGTYLKFRTTNK